MDPWGKLHRAGSDGPQAHLFGAYVDMIHDARTADLTFNGQPVEGFYGDLVPTTAKVLARFSNGNPAITEALIGRGRALLLGFDAGMRCHRPGNEPIEALLARLAWGEARPDWRSDAPIAFRRSAPAADHYFLINDGPARAATIRAYDHTYTAGHDVIKDEPLDVTGTIAVDLPTNSAVWVRLARQEEA
jgi:beta-galactosidase